MIDVWARLGVSLSLTSSEAKAIFQEGNPEKMVEVIKTVVSEGRFRLDGETYIPECSVDTVNWNLGLKCPARDYECTI